MSYLVTGEPASAVLGQTQGREQGAALALRLAGSLLSGALTQGGPFDVVQVQTGGLSQDKASGILQSSGDILEPHARRLRRPARAPHVLHVHDGPLRAERADRSGLAVAVRERPGLQDRAPPHRPAERRVRPGAGLRAAAVQDVDVDALVPADADAGRHRLLPPVELLTRRAFRVERPAISAEGSALIAERLSITSALLIVNPAARQAAGRESAAVAAFARAGVACTVHRTERAGHAGELAAAHGATLRRRVHAWAATARRWRSSARSPAREHAGRHPARRHGQPDRPHARHAARRACRRARAPRRVRSPASISGSSRPTARRRGRSPSPPASGSTPAMIEGTPPRLEAAAWACWPTRRHRAARRLAGRRALRGARHRRRTRGIGRDAAAVHDRQLRGGARGPSPASAPASAPTTGVLDLCIFSPRTLRRGGRVLWRLAAARLPARPGAGLPAGRAVPRGDGRPRAAQADGELLGCTPLVVATIRAPPRCSSRLR